MEQRRLSLISLVDGILEFIFEIPIFVVTCPVFETLME